MEKHYIALQLSNLLGEPFSREWVFEQLEFPKQDDLGDVAFPCFQLAKVFKKSPAAIAEDLASQIDHEILQEVRPSGNYLNFFLNQEFISEHTFKQMLSKQKNYGSHSFGKGKTVVLDMSAPNIAKPFSMGHLRSTVIGNALANLAEKCGYKSVKINYIGDYGTQFGKLLAAYKLWGNEEKIRQDPIPELTKIYVKFHEQAQQDPQLVEKGREWFKKLEDQEEEAVSLWKWFKEVSLAEFNHIYNLLGISFDLTRGEAYYNDKMETVVHQLSRSQLLEESEGAKVVQLDEFGLPPCLIRKSNGTSIYATRDLTAAIDRYESYAFNEALYVVGNEQSLHFQQIKHVLEKLKFPWAENIKHISFGMMLQNGKKMSTRKGKTVLLQEVLEKAVEQAKINITKKNPHLTHKAETARKVGVGAVIFHDLKQHRRNDVEFSLEDMLTFEGNTAPYLQYAYARSCSLLKRGTFDIACADTSLNEQEAWPLIKQLRHFPEVIRQAYHDYDPSKVAKYLLDTAKQFNKYYSEVKIIGSSQESKRLTLVYCFSIIIEEGLSLLGIEAPAEM
ncbi:arginine--tRNA ligase [Halobacillus salinarum]|uniref:Arginine--tRNA ligase n=1 Tax=Halobacillus salinarum TaxID=2932257 RepID=A0ABY4EHI1_9BACI|nr:arginine--tRNA ligase [Halobacillus salinarum]UOQ43890.1 arginine--tRNA ligase [Halobacillus salinarum]